MNTNKILSSRAGRIEHRSGFHRKGRKDVLFAAYSSSLRSLRFGFLTDALGRRLVIPILVLALSLAGPASAIGSVPGEAHRAHPARSTTTIAPSAVGDPIVLYDGALGGTP